MKKYIILLAAQIFVGAFAYSQPKQGINTDPIKVVKAYEPKLAAAEKVFAQAILKDEKETKPSLTYTQLEKTLKLNFEPLPINPIKTQIDQKDDLQKSYVKMGIGNYKTPMLKAHLMSTYNNKVEYSFDVGHMSSQGAIKLDNLTLNNANVSLTNLNASVKSIQKTYNLEGSIGFNRFANRWYGLTDTVAFPTNTAIDKQRFSTFRLSTGIASNGQKKSDLGYKSHINFYNISSLYQQSEMNVRYAGDLYSDNKQYQWNVNAGVDYTRYAETVSDSSDLKNTVSRSIITLTPKYLFNGENWKAEIGFTGAVNTKTNISATYHAFPSIDFSYKLSDATAIAFFKLNGGIQRNALNTFIDRNAFIAARGLNFNHSIQSINAALGLKGSPSTLFQYNIEASWSSVKNQLFWMNDTSNATRLLPVYDNVGIFTFNGQMQYKIAEKLTVESTLQLRSFAMDSLVKPFMVPTFQWGLAGKYYFSSTFTAQLRLIGFNGIHYMQTDGIVQQANGIVDVNLDLNYELNNKIGLFVSFNNIASNKYLRYFNYPIYGFNLLGGIKLQLY